MIKIIYNSPAMPQGDYNFSLGVTYTCVKSEKTDNYIVKGSDIEKEFSLEFIKSIFKPCDNYSWDMLEVKVVKEKTTKTKKSGKTDK